jgi:hypothetical protein
VASDEFTHRIEALLSAHAITAWQYARRPGGHRSVVVQHDGKRHTFIFPSSSKSWNGPRNMVSIMKRRLCLRRVSV